MNRYTIRRRLKGDIGFMLLGTIEGASEAEALDAIAKTEGDADFAAQCEKLGLSRDDYRVEKV